MEERIVGAWHVTKQPKYEVKRKDSVCNGESGRIDGDKKKREKRGGERNKKIRSIIFQRNRVKSKLSTIIHRRIIEKMK